MWAILAVLFVLPFVQSFGTNTRLYTIGFNAFAAWAAVGVAVLTGIWATAPIVARAILGVVLAGGLVATSTIAYTGLFRSPYRTAGHAASTTASTLPTLDGLYLTPALDARLDQLTAVLRPYNEPPGRAILAFDKMAGLVLALGGRPLGEAWIAPTERARTAAGIEEACRRERPARPPIVILNRTISDVETTALQACGVDFSSEYVQLGPVRQTGQVQVWIPKAELVARTTG
jgi:hypothetical protein